MKLKLKMIICEIFVATTVSAREKLIIVNEGLWQTDNGRLTYFEDGEIVSNQWFRDINGCKLGDTPNDIIQVNDDLIAIALNWSNIVQFISPDGKAMAATEDVPNNRKLATDGEFVYVTSYAHETVVKGSLRQFTKGYVAKIDTKDFKVVDAVEVGYEPEGIAYFDGYLFVANTGGYAFQEGHDYESTVSVIDAATLQLYRTIDTGQINLYGKMSQSGKYLCINSPGDYYDYFPATIILDCEAVLEGKSEEDCLIKIDKAATANCTTSDGRFYAVGSSYSYFTGEYEYNYNVIDPELLFESDGVEGVSDDFPGNVKDELKKMSQPYGIYVNPYSGFIYATDSGEYTGAGSLYQWDADGNFLGKYKTYINPAHLLALPPESNGSGSYVDKNIQEEIDSPIYNLQGLPVSKPLPGQLYIRNGKKFVAPRR